MLLSRGEVGTFESAEEFVANLDRLDRKACERQAAAAAPAGAHGRAGAGAPPALDAEEPPAAPQNASPWSGTAADVTELTGGPGDPHWRADMDRVDQAVRDPHERE